LAEGFSLFEPVFISPRMSRRSEVGLRQMLSTATLLSSCSPLAILVAQGALHDEQVLMVAPGRHLQMAFMSMPPRTSRMSVMEIISRSSAQLSEDATVQLHMPERASLPPPSPPCVVPAPTPSVAESAGAKSSEGPENATEVASGATAGPGNPEAALLAAAAIAPTPVVPQHPRPKQYAVLAAIGASCAYLVLIVQHCAGLLREFTPGKPLTELLSVQVDNCEVASCSSFGVRRPRRAARLCRPDLALPPNNLCGGCTDGQGCSESGLVLPATGADVGFSVQHPL